MNQKAQLHQTFIYQSCMSLNVPTSNTHLIQQMNYSCSPFIQFKLFLPLRHSQLSGAPRISFFVYTVAFFSILEYFKECESEKLFSIYACFSVNSFLILKKILYPYSSCSSSVRISLAYKSLSTQKTSCHNCEFWCNITDIR